MASFRAFNHRRRSQSTSSPSSPTPRRDDSWRPATKRAHPHHSVASVNSDLSSPQKWDVDAWRRGSKRPRRDLSPSFDDIDEMQRTSPPTPAFAATSAEFQLFPKTRCSDSGSWRSVFNDDSSSGEMDFNTEADLTRLRSNAFRELHRSVAENGEGLVRFMRDYETSRLRSGVYTKAKESQRRGRKRSIIASRRIVDVEDESDEEDEVQIFAGEIPERICGIPIRSQSLKGSHSLERIPQHDDIHSSPGSASSPGATRHSSPSAYPSDDEDAHTDAVRISPTIAFSSSPYNSSMSITPALSQTRTNSANSSIVSLPLPPPLPIMSTCTSNIDAAPSSSAALSAADQAAISASRSEKAIAALSLAIANGAGGLNDYESVRAAQPSPASNDDHAGEMWH